MTGRTQDAGWQVGARRTLPLEPARAWELLTSPAWLPRWAGVDALDPDDPAVRSLTPGVVVRVRTARSLVQLRLLRAATGTTVAFHEEHLADQAERTGRRAAWAALLDDLAAEVQPA